MKRQRVSKKTRGVPLSVGDGREVEALMQKRLEILRRLRVGRGIPVVDLALAAGLSRQGLSLMESGKGNPEERSFLRVCRALNVAPHAVDLQAEKELGWAQLPEVSKWQLYLASSRFVKNRLEIGAAGYLRAGIDHDPNRTLPGRHS